MSITGLGQGGSFRVQAEAVYDTPIATSQTFLPLAEGTLVYIVEQIAKQNLIGSRVPQAPQDGRKKVGASDLTFEIAPDLMGLFMQLPFGTSSDAGSDAYTHTWLVPISGENAGGSWTVEQFIGSDTGEQFGGVKCTKFMINWDSEATVKIVMTLVGVGADDVAVTRPTTVTVSSNDYYTFCNMVTQITPSGVAQFTQRVNSGEIMVDFGYLDDGQRYQAGSCEAGAPIFGTIPAVTVKLNIDAEKRFETWAQSQHSFKIDVTATSTEIAHGTTPYSFVAEIPAMILDPATNRETALDLISQDLSFTANVGGTTTGSGTDVVQAEIRVVDDTAAYA